jgi:hypothetical protein
MQGGFSLWLDGQPIDRGLAVAAGTTLTYDLRGAYRVFYGKVGTADGAPAGSKLRFVVLVDGKEAYRSPDRAAGEGALEIAVNVEGAKALSLRVEPSGVLDPAAVAVWANPVLVRP